MKSIIICENDEDIILISKKILERENYSVIICRTTDELFDELQSRSPDMILMDVWIPTIGGEEATVKIKENGAYKNIPVVLFSANIEIEKIAHRSGADDFLVKPFEIQELVAISARFCSDNSTDVPSV